MDLDRIASLAELPGLVAGLAGVDAHPYNGDLPEGVALSQLDPPVLASDPRAADVARDWSLDEAGFERLTTAFVSATDGRRKLIRRKGRDLLFDLESDPLELSPRDVSSDSASGELERLRQALTTRRWPRPASSPPRLAAHRHAPLRPRMRPRISRSGCGCSATCRRFERRRSSNSEVVRLGN